MVEKREAPFDRMCHHDGIRPARKEDIPAAVRSDLNAAFSPD
jgi:hypothetical protein